MDAAIQAEKLREDAITRKDDFTFETVLSTNRNLNLLRKAREEGYFVRCVYVLTADPEINVIRIRVRQASGGHGVPEDKIRLRYDRALALIPELVEICDILHIYDNTDKPFRIFKKRKDVFYKWENEYWDNEAIEKLTGITQFI
jgi:predicted ABC-type ATPase